MEAVAISSQFLSIEDDLLVDVSSVVFFDDFFAELFHGLHNLLLDGGHCVHLLLFLVAVDTLVVSKQLRQVLRSSICDRPLELCWIEYLFLLLTFFLLLCCRWLLFLAFFSLLLLFLYLCLFLLKLFKFIIYELGILLHELHRDHRVDLTDVLFDGKELVHESHLKLLLSRLELV